MQNSGKTTVNWALTMACWSAIGSGCLLSGVACNKMESAARQADRTVEEQLEKSRVDLETGGTKGKTDSFASLTKAAGEAGASSSAKVRAKSALAQEEFNRAARQLPVLNARTLQIEQTLWDLRQAGSQVQGTQHTGAAYALQEPKEALAKLEEDRATITKNVDKAKTDAQTLQTDLDKRKAEIDALTADRKAAQTESDSLEEKSSAVKGEESVKLFGQASEARIKAGTLAAQIESKSAALLPIQKLVAIARQQQQFWDNAAKDAPGAAQQLDERKAQLESGWQDTLAQVQATTELAKKIAAKIILPGGDAEHPNAGANLVKMVQENEKQRGEIAKLLIDSAKHAGEASTAAKQLYTELQARIGEAKNPGAPELVPMKGMLGVYDGIQYALQEGNAQNALADLYAGQVVEMQHRKQNLDALGKTLLASGLTLPPEFAVADVAKVIEDAVKGYKDAEKSLEPVATATQNGDNLQITKNAARVGLLHAHLGRFQLTRDEEAKTAFKLDQVQAKEANIDLPPTLRQTLE